MTVFSYYTVIICNFKKPLKAATAQIDDAAVLETSICNVVFKNTKTAFNTQENQPTWVKIFHLYVYEPIGSYSYFAKCTVINVWSPSHEQNMLINC